MTDSERVSLYLDNELSATERAAFERDLKSRPDLVEKLDRWGRNDEWLRTAFDMPVPHQCAAQLGLAGANVVDVAIRRTQPIAGKDGMSARALWLGVTAVAASIAAVLAFMLLPAGRKADSPFASSAFQMAMERLPSRETLAISGGVRVTPRLTFLDSNRRFCREFNLGGSRQQVGIACRNEERWAVEGVTPTGQPEGTTGRFQTAGGQEYASLDELYNRLQASDPLDAAQERRLIESGWRGDSVRASN